MVLSRKNVELRFYDVTIKFAKEGIGLISPDRDKNWLVCKLFFEYKKSVVSSANDQAQLSNFIPKITGKQSEFLQAS